MGEGTRIFLFLDVKNPKSLIPLLGLGAVLTLTLIISLILLPIFWTDIINSEFVTERLQELLMADEDGLNPAERRQLYENLKNMVARFGLLVILAFVVLFLALEIYFNYVMYRLYNNLNKANCKPGKTEIPDRSTAAKMKNRKSVG